MNILVTGGLGYIGSHTVLELSKEHEITIVDNLYNSHIEVLKKLEFLTKKIISFYNIDITDFEKLKTLFEKFTRIDDSTTRTTRGTGLGLFIVKGLVESMGGDIRLYSNEECGFCVKVYLSTAVKEEVYE